MNGKNITTEDIKRSVAEIGIELSDNDLQTYTDDIESYIQTLDQLEPDTIDSSEADNIRKGKDSYNAFLYRFEMDSESGPLTGLRIGIKDNFAVSGVPMTCGSDVFYFEPPYNATVVDRIRKQGGDIIGTTNMDEFAFGTTGDMCAHGEVKNPRATGCIPGGSTSGGGAAVAGGLADVVIGSDTGGSVRIPAALCGVVGLKPTYRSISRFGFMDLAPSHDHVGILANSTTNVEAVFDAVRGPDVRDPSTIGTHSTQCSPPEPKEKYKVGLIKELFDESEPGVTDCVMSCLDQLEQEGIETEWVSFDSFETLRIAGSCIVLLEFAKFVADNGLTFGSGTEYSETLRSVLDKATEDGSFQNRAREQLLKGKPILDHLEQSEYIKAQNTRQEFIRTVNDLFETFDALVSPTVQVTAPEPGEVGMTDTVPRPLANTVPFNMSGHPSLTVPCGTADGKPVGIQIVTPWHHEKEAIQIGEFVESQ